MCKSTCVSVAWELVALGVFLLTPASISVSQETGCPLHVP